jgi:predicted nucleotidyltransferase
MIIAREPLGTLSFHKTKNILRFMKRSVPSLAPILRSDAQGRILADLLADPARELSLSDLARHTGASVPTVAREIEHAEAARIVTSRRLGNARLVRADTTNPLYQPLARLIAAIYGPPAIIAEVFARISGIDEVHLFGSWAARYQGQPGSAPNDIDVLVVGHPDRNKVYEAAEAAEQRLGMPVQVVFRTAEQWADQSDSFIAEVRSRPIVPVLTREDDRA